MSVNVMLFGQLDDGRAVRRYTLVNGVGTAVSVLDYGATLQSFIFDNKDILLGYETVEDYVTANGSYIGATVGRYANRMSNGRFTLNGKDIQLACNEENRHGHLHGGNVGFDKKMWDVAVLDEGDEPSVRFSLVSPDGEENYPGTLNVSVTFSLSADNALSLAYEATTDKDTVLNLTNHSYFNLNGCDGGAVTDTLMQINADTITPVDDVLIPTGDYMPVEGTPLDFRRAKPIGDGIGGKHPQVAIAGGIDHNFVLSKTRPAGLLTAIKAKSPKTGIRIVCETDLPGVQVYTANFLDESYGKMGKTWGQYDGFCMETQFFPDSPNHPQFPSTVLHANETYHSLTRFTVDKKPL